MSVPFEVLLDEPDEHVGTRILSAPPDPDAPCLNFTDAIIHIAEIDPLVISASIRAMGFPAFSVVTQSAERVSKPSPIDQVLWKGIHERLYLFEADAEKFIIDNANIYDIVFIDAYDGDDIFPH